MRERMPSNQHPSVISAANVETISTSCRDDAFMTEADAKKFLLHLAF
jgi:hypothetical protein